MNHDHCLTCNTVNPDGANFCMQCGTKLPVPVVDLSKIPDKYRHPFGFWEVTRPADCEGRSLLYLGTYEGYVDYIARRLASAEPGGYYAYSFRAVPKLEDIPPNSDLKEVEVAFAMESRTWERTSGARVAVAEAIFQGRPVQVLPSPHTGSFKLKFRRLFR